MRNNFDPDNKVDSAVQMLIKITDAIQRRQGGVSKALGASEQALLKMNKRKLGKLVLEGT